VQFVNFLTLKTAVIFSLLIGALFYINGFDYLWSFFFSADDLEVIRKGGSWFFSVPFFDRVSHALYFISLLGLIGLLLATIISYRVCKKLELAKFNVVIVFLLAFLINKPLMDNFRFFGYKNALFLNFSMHVYFLTNFLIAIVIGSAFLFLPLYFHVLKFANRGGKI
jgi:hypothetical protein